MSIFKHRRSKSAESNASRSRSDEDGGQVGERPKTPVEGDDGEDDLLARLETLGSLTENLDRRKIDGRELDRVVKELFDKYKDQEPCKYNTDAFLQYNSCKNSLDLLPPHNLSKHTKRMDLDRISKLQRVFAAIPTFSNDPSFTIREFLVTLNNTADHLGGGIGPQITENEFELILNSKLSPRVKSTINSYKSDTLSGLYSNLINLFDESEGKREAFSNIVNGSKKFTNLRSFTEEMLRLLSLSQKKIEHQSELFIHALETVLPARVYEKVSDYADNYSAMSGGGAPPLPKVVDFVYKWRTEIDLYMSARKNKAAHGFNYVGTGEKPEETELEKNEMPKEDRYCTLCKRKGHSDEYCFRNAICKQCGRTGHIAKFCRSNRDGVCARCGRIGHDKTQCNIRCRMCNGDHGTVTCPLYLGEEPSRIHCQHCMDLVNLKLYHPSNKCQVNNRPAKN